MNNITPENILNFSNLLHLAYNNHASDIHLSACSYPMFRVNGILQQIPLSANITPLNNMQIVNILCQFIDKKLIDKLLNTQEEIDFAFSFDDVGRIRGNAFYHLHGIGVAIRLLPSKIPTFHELNLNETFNKICEFPNGLVLVTGPTGSGKSTTIASMINRINHTKHGHIITIEDPIEYVYKNEQCLIQQREINNHTATFQHALKAILREDPNYIVIGELRDLETIRLALTIAETGHLVFATLHTNSASSTINRIIDVFPAEEKAITRSLLASSLRAVVSQVLTPTANGKMVAIREIMLSNLAIQNMIREDRVQQINSVIQTNSSIGMKTFNQAWEEFKEQETKLFS